MEELLLPTTDRGVVLQLVVVLAAAGIGIYLVRRDRDLVLFVVGLAVLALGFMALRAVH